VRPPRYVTTNGLLRTTSLLDRKCISPNNGSMKQGNIGFVHQRTLRAGYLVFWSGVRMSPLGTSATDWPTISVPDDR
jgi:hypothetical protein